MYIRFVIAKRDPQSGRRQGLFYAAYELESVGLLGVDDLKRLAAVHRWFFENLDEPTRAAVSARPHATAMALSWFKETATEHVSKMRELQRILEDHGVYAETIRTRRPGYIVYEDAHQVLAQPFADTPV